MLGNVESCETFLYSSNFSIDAETSDLEITVAEDEDDLPPAYNQAAKFPVMPPQISDEFACNVKIFQEAAKKPLPLIVPVYPTLRRMMRQQQQGYDVDTQDPSLVGKPSNTSLLQLILQSLSLSLSLFLSLSLSLSLSFSLSLSLSLSCNRTSRKRHVLPLQRFLESIVQQDLRRFLPETCFEVSLTQITKHNNS